MTEAVDPLGIYSDGLLPQKNASRAKPRQPYTTLRNLCSKRQIVDTNVLIRFFTGEPSHLAARAWHLVDRADRGEMVLVVLPVIVAETVYTLESFYEIERKEVASKLLAFLESRGIEAAEPLRVTDALKRCRDMRAHFADAYLAATALDQGEPIASFDRDFDKFRDVVRIEPPESE